MESEYLEAKRQLLRTREKNLQVGRVGVGQRREQARLHMAASLWRGPVPRWGSHCLLAEAPTRPLTR